MYAIIETGGKQYRVREGDRIDVERLEGEAGETVAFEQVLFVGGESPRVGSPAVDGARVSGTIVEQTRGDKIIVFKFKRRKMYRRKAGHRQYLTGVRIDQIDVPGVARKPKAEAAQAAPKPKPAPKKEEPKKAPEKAKAAAADAEKAKAAAEPAKKPAKAPKEKAKAEAPKKKAKAKAPKKEAKAEAPKQDAKAEAPQKEAKPAPRAEAKKKADDKDSDEG